MCIRDSERWDEVCDLAADRAIAVHVDGARLLNAVVASGVSAKQWSERADTVWIDFSKGLGAPMGACLAGSEETIDMAWLWKHRLGGAMRQSGLMAAAALDVCNKANAATVFFVAWVVQPRFFWKAFKGHYLGL